MNVEIVNNAVQFIFGEFCCEFLEQWVRDSVAYK
jgi:hypothetical protein